MKKQRTSKEINQNIRDACKKFVHEGKIHFKSEDALLKNLGIGQSIFTKARQIIVKGFGITWEIGERRRTTEEVDQAIYDVCQRLVEEEKKHFKSEAAILKKLRIDSQSFTDVRRMTVRGFGITWNKDERNRTTENVNQEIRNVCQKLVEEEKTKFKSENKLLKELGLSSVSFTEARKMIVIEFGITWDKLERKRTPEEVDQDIRIACQRLIEANTTNFKSEAPLLKELCIDNQSFNDARQMIVRGFGITWDKEDRRRTSEEIDQYIRDVCHRFVAEENTHINSETTLLKEFGLDTKAFTETRKMIVREFGITWNKEERNRTPGDVDQDIRDTCQRLIKAHTTHFKSETALLKQFGINGKSFTEARQSIVKEFGISWDSELELSENIIFALQSLEDEEIKVESIGALIEYSRDILMKTIHKNNLYEEEKRAIMAITSQIMNFDIVQSKSIVEEAASQLILQGKADFWIMELKFQLYLNGYYLCEETIMKALALLEHDVESTISDHIDKRLRLAIYASEQGIPSVEFRKNLPTINISENATIYLKGSIQSKKQFMSLWKEYALFLIKNDLVGHISKTPIQLDWDGKLDSLIAKNESYARAFFLDDDHINILNEMGYEGIAALAYLATRKANRGLPDMFKTLPMRAKGFFLFLNSKGYALYHSKYISLQGHEKIKLFFGRRSIFTLFENVLKGDCVNPDRKSIRKFKQNNAIYNAYYLALATDPKANLLNLKQEQILAYIESTRGYADVGGVAWHNYFVYDILYGNGNENAIKPKEKLTLKTWLDIEIQRTITRYSDDVFSWYEELLKQVLGFANFRLDEEKITFFTAKKLLRACLFLLEYLSTFDHKLSRKELSDTFNPLSSETKHRMFEWAKLRGDEAKYRQATSSFKLIFERIEIEEYKGVFLATMKLQPQSTARRLVRKGMEIVVYQTLQEVARRKPPISKIYILKRNANDEKRSMIDLSWWPFANQNLSPILPVFEWLISKLPRRVMHLRYADVNEFLQYDKAGNLLGIYFSTDKNFANPSLFIPAMVLQLIFIPEEIKFLENFVAYIKVAYSNLTPVNFDGGDFGLIQPLFPHHERNDVIAKHVIDGYHKKTMMMVQLEVNRLAKEGYYDNHYEGNQLARMKEYLSTLVLVQTKGHNKNTIKVPETYEAIGLLTEQMALRDFTDSQGIHNLRHAGATALAHMGLDLMQIKVVTGHKSDSVLLTVYLHGETTSLRMIVQNAFSKLRDLHGTPRDVGEGFVNRITKASIESEDPDFILDMLKKNGFITASRNIKNKDINIFGSERDYRADGRVDNGLEIAANFHPATWKVSNIGICPVDGRCPEGTNGCCGLCPLSIFHIAFIEGIINKIQDTLIELKLVSNKIAESKVKGNFGGLEQLKNSHQHLLSELLGWYDVMQILEEQYKTLDQTNDGSGTVPVKTTSDRLVAFRSVSIDEAMMEAIVGGRAIQEDTVIHDNYIARLSYKVYLQAGKRYDVKTIGKMENEGIEWLIVKYANCDLEQKKELLQFFLGEQLNQTSSNELFNRKGLIEKKV